MHSYVSAYMGTIIAAVVSSISSPILSAYMGSIDTTVVSSISSSILSAFMCAVLAADCNTYIIS